MPVSAYTGALVEDFLSGFQVPWSITLPPHFLRSRYCLVRLEFVYRASLVCQVLSWKASGKGPGLVLVGTHTILGEESLDRVVPNPEP